MTARLSLLSALCLTLLCLPSCKTVPTAYAPPQVDCAIFDPPAVALPALPTANTRDPITWQIYAHGWQAFGEHVLLQRVSSAECVRKLKSQGVLK